MLSQLKISAKLIGVIAVVVLSASAAVGAVVYRRAARALHEDAVAVLVAERAARARQVSTYVRRVHNDLQVASKLLVTQIALRDLPAAIGAAAESRPKALFDPIARGLKRGFSLHDVLLVGADGRVLYSCLTEIPVGTNVQSGALAASGLARATARAAASARDAIVFVDFEPAARATGAPNGFLSAPVFDGETGTRLGVLVYHLAFDEINAITNDAAGFGDSGETYLVGPDLLMRSESRLAGGSTVLTRRVDTAAARRAMAGESGTIEQTDYRGARVLSSFAPIDIEGVRWAILAEVDLAEALAPARKFGQQLLLLFVVVGMISGLVLWIALRQIVLLPVAALAAGARRVEKREYSRPVELTSQDELGLLGRSFNKMMDAVGSQVDELKLGQQLLEAAPDAMVVVDAKGQIVLINAAAERLFGYTRADLVGQSIEALVPEASAGRHVHQRNSFLAKPSVRGMGTGAELQGRRKDGSLVPVEISLSPLHGPDGLMVVAAVRDISDRRAAEKSLRQSEERLAAAASGANLGLWDVDPQSGEVLVNSIFERQLDYPPLTLRENDDKWARLRGGLMGWVDLLHPDDRSGIATLMDQFLSGQSEFYKAEQRVRAADGSYRWILSVGNSVARDPRGVPLRVNGVHLDISEMKGLQQNLERRYEELQNLQGLRDGLVHMIVHDLRSPLTSVLGYLELLQTETAAPAEDRSKFVEAAYAGGSQMKEMISSLLDVNRLEAGEMPVDRQAVDLSEVAGEAMRSLGGLIVGRDVTQSPSSAPVACNCDPALIGRVVANLLGNALKFTPRKGTIVVTVTQNGDRSRVEIVDTGPGIPADFIPRVFDKFSQAGEGRSRKRYSSGLGLAFCKLAVEAHGGAIGVTSEVGVGSCFWFELPN